MKRNKKKLKRITSILVAVLMVATSALGMVSYATETVPGEESPEVTSIGAVTVNVVEDDSSTNKTVSFQGGAISASTAPTIENGTFSGAYIVLGGDQTKSYPISWLGTVNGDVRYMISDGNSNAITEEGLSVTSAKSSSDQIMFKYTMAAAAKHNITYNVTGLSSVNMTVLGGHAAVTKGPKTIVDGQNVYFQVTRAPGTKVTVTTSSGSVSRTSTSESGRVETWKLSGTTGDVTVTITEAWAQSSYTMGFKTATTAKSVGGTWNGRLVIRGIYKNGTLSEGSATTGSSDSSSNYYKANAPSSGTLTPNLSTTVSNGSSMASFKYYYILNTIANYSSTQGAWHHTVNSVVVTTGEDGDIPEVITLPSNSTGATTCVFLQYGEKAGTKVTITCLDYGSEAACDSTKIPAYSLQFDNVHSDLKTTWSYVPTSQSFLFVGQVLGVHAQIYRNSDADSVGNRWQDISDGMYMYGKYVATNLGDGNYFKIRWKDKEGYYASALNITNINGVTTTYSLANSNVTTESDGYNYVSLKGYTYNGDPGVRVSFTASTLNYKVTYDGNGGTYSSGSTPTDDTSYDVIYKSSVLVDKEYPTKDGYVFMGYKINGDSIGTTYWPGQAIEITDEDKVDLSSVAASGGTKTIKLDAQWKALYPNPDASTVTVNVNRQNEDGSYTTTSSVVTSAIGSVYRVMGYQATSQNLKLYSTEDITGAVTAAGVVAKITYKKPVKVTYVDNNNYNDASNAKVGTYTGTLPTEVSDFAFNDVTLADKTSGSTSYQFTKDPIKVSSQETGKVEDENSTALTYEDTWKYFEHTGWVKASESGLNTADSSSQVYNFGQTVTVPWSGLTLAPYFTETTQTGERVMTIEAQNFEIDMDTAKKFVGQTDIDPTSDLGQELIRLAGDAKATFKDWDETTASDEDITAITSNIGSGSGDYEVTFTSASGLTRTITVKVSGETIEANDFQIDIDDIDNLTDQDIIDKAGATAWTGDDRDNTLDLTVEYVIEKKAGEYEITFRTANGTEKVVKVTVIDNTVVDQGDKVKKTDSNSGDKTTATSKTTAKAKGKTAKTGDDFNLFILLGIMVIAIVAAGATAIVRRRS